MHSEDEAYRGTMTACGVEGEPHTLIVTRRHTSNPTRVWLTLNGAWKIAVQLTDTETAQLTDLLTQARQPPPDPPRGK